MTVKYEPDYTDRDSYYANKDRAVAEREKEIAEGGPKPGAEPKAHDYRRGGWGHAANISEARDGGKKVKMHGFGTGIRPGDFIIKDNGRGGIASYKVDKIDYKRDPPDMWFASATWTPGVFGARVDNDEIVRIDQ